MNPEIPRTSRSLLFVELGSVSFKASIVLKDSQNRILSGSVVEERKLKNLLGLKVYRQRRINNSIVAEARTWFEEVRSWAISYATSPADEVLVVATAAFRDMELFPDLQEAVRSAFGAAIQVLEGFIEAQMLVNGYGKPREDYRRSILFDLGGGSLEVVCIARAFVHFTSLQLGAGRVTAWLMDGHSLGEVKRWIFGELGEKCQTLKCDSPSVWLGTGGAVRSFSGLKEDPEEPIRDHEIHEEVRRLKDLLFERNGTLKAEAIRDNFQGLIQAAPVDLPEHRKRIHLGGILILDSLCKFFRIGAVKLEKASLRAGALEMLRLLRTTPIDIVGAMRDPAGKAGPIEGSVDPKATAATIDVGVSPLPDGPDGDRVVGATEVIPEESRGNGNRKQANVPGSRSPRTRSTAR